MLRNSLRILTLAPTIVALSGCHPNAIPEAKHLRSQEASPPPIGSVPKGKSGPLKLGMPEAEVRGLRNVTVAPLRGKVEGVKGPALEVTQYGLPIALAELDGGKVTRIRYLTKDYVTPEGARVGMRAQELGKLYGKGRLDRVTQGVYARFDRSPEYRFGFVVRNPGSVGSWDQLLALNPRVSVVVVSQLVAPHFDAQGHAVPAAQ
jgi:hypothetical protein